MIEELAALEHEQWAHWMRYMIIEKSAFRLRADGYVQVDIKQEDFDRWTRQRMTKYEDLSEQEKESDRYWARKVLNLINNSVYELPH